MSELHPSEPRRNGPLPSDPPPIRWLPALVEIAATLTALLAMVALFRNKLRTELVFFGEIPEVTQEHVTTYRTWLLVLVGAVVVSFAAAFRRRRGAVRRIGGSVWWHGLVLLLGLVVAVLAHVSI